MMMTSISNPPPPPHPPVTTIPQQDGKLLHIAMFPWLAFGHIIPYLELAKLFALKGHRVSFISTPRNIDRLPKLPPNLTSLIDLVKLPLPHLENLPEGAEATIDLPFDKVKYLKIASDGLQGPMAEFLRSSSPDWILVDFVYYWLCPIAAELGISTAFFSIFIAGFMVFAGPTSALIHGDEDRTKLEDFTVPPKWVPFESNLAFRPYEFRYVIQSFIGQDDDATDAYRVGKTIEACDVVLVRSCFDLEPEWLNLLGDLYKKTVIPVGQLPTTAYDVAGDENDHKWVEIKEWLDQKERGSVVYVAFGSEAKPSQAELTGIALGLEQSGLPFFWVFRNRRGSADSEAIELPEGFEERTRGRGLVWTSWAPQLKILSHGAVGGFLTHSGWSSVVEAIQFEKSLILLTFLADQGINARLLEKKKIGYPIPRDEVDGSFTREAVAEALRLVMVEEEGRVYREKVKEMKEVFGDSGKQDQYVGNLVNYFRSHRRTK